MLQSGPITVDRHHRRQLAVRIHEALQHELGQGIDVKQMLDSTLYARDVLLVCQAYPGSALQRLGQQFRLAGIAVLPEPAPRAVGRRRGSSDFGHSKPASSQTHADFTALVGAAHGARQATRRWLAPSTWFAR